LITNYVPDRASRSCPDPEILGTGSGEVFGGGGAKPSQIRPHLMWKRKAVEIQQQWNEHEQKVLSTRSRHDTAEFAANRVRILNTYIVNPLHFSFLMLHYVTSLGYVIVVFLPGE
jgi:hypothetical protein